MDERTLAIALRGQPLGALKFFESAGSTNQIAAQWADEGAPDSSIVIADEQTAGRGRMSRQWFTPKGAALAFSLVLRPKATIVKNLAQEIAHTTALGALAVCCTLRENYNLVAEIKWPNDVLLERRKTAGVLVETYWEGDRPSAVIMGIGVNVTPASIPSASLLNYPATAVEIHTGYSIKREEFLSAILSSLFSWREQLGTARFLQTWDEMLAFRDEWVHVHLEDGASLEGRITGLAPDGSLRLLDNLGDSRALLSGEVHLRPVDNPQE